MGIVSAIAWGLGYFGQPHILTRFMAIKSSKDIKPARRIAMVWVIVSLAMAVLVGILASPYIQYMFKTGQITDPSSLSILNANGMLEGANTQKVFMVLVQNMFPTVIAGLLLSAVLGGYYVNSRFTASCCVIIILIGYIQHAFQQECFGKDIA